MSAALQLEAGELEPDYDQEPQVTSADLAEDHLRCLAHWQRLRQERLAHAERQVHKVIAWRDRELAQLDRRIAWHEQGLRAYLWRTGLKSVRLVYGALKRIKGRERIEVLDEPRFLATAPSALVHEKVVRSPDRRAILDHIHRTGEIPEGVDLVRGEDTLKVETQGGPDD